MSAHQKIRFLAREHARTGSTWRDLRWELQAEIRYGEIPSDIGGAIVRRIGERRDKDPVSPRSVAFWLRDIEHGRDFRKASTIADRWFAEHGISPEMDTAPSEDDAMATWIAGDVENMEAPDPDPYGTAILGAEYACAPWPWKRPDIERQLLRPSDRLLLDKARRARKAHETLGMRLDLWWGLQLWGRCPVANRRR